MGSARTLTRAALALLTVVAALLAAPATADALPRGAVLDRIDLTITLPKTPKTPATYDFALVYSSVGSSVTVQRVDVSPTRVTHRTDTPVSYKFRNHEDWTERWIEVKVPQSTSGPSIVTLKWTEPLFKSTYPKFWWDRMDAMITFPFSKHLRPVRSGMNVVVLGPAKGVAQSGFKCTRDTQTMRCERFFSARQVAAMKDDEHKGLRIAVAANDDMNQYALVGVQVLLWTVLIPLCGVWRMRAFPFAKKSSRNWMFGRLVVGLGLFYMGVAGWAYLLDGNSGNPMAEELGWGAAGCGLAAIFLGICANQDSAARSWFGWILILAAIPAALVALLVAKSGVAGLITIGALVMTGVIAMFAKGEQ